MNTAVGYTYIDTKKRSLAGQVGVKKRGRQFAGYAGFIAGFVFLFGGISFGIIGLSHLTDIQKPTSVQESKYQERADKLFGKKEVPNIKEITQQTLAIEASLGQR